VPFGWLGHRLLADYEADVTLTNDGLEQMITKAKESPASLDLGKDSTESPNP
jgi:hypothetical protein